jgi:hypothetical protein
VIDRNATFAAMPGLQSITVVRIAAGELTRAIEETADAIVRMATERL